MFYAFVEMLLYFYHILKTKKISPLVNLANRMDTVVLLESHKLLDQHIYLMTLKMFVYVL